MTPDNSPFMIPPHIEAAGLRGKPVDYEWDEADTLQYYDRTSKQLSDRILPLSPRARLALTAGITEWIVWRLDGLSDFADLRQFVQAVWAGVHDGRYVIEWTRPPNRELRGPVLKPQWIAARLLNDVFRAHQRRVPTRPKLMNLAFLAQHMVKGSRAYKTWLTEVTARLARLSPISDFTREFYKTLDHTAEEWQAFEFGAPVPREAMDTSSPFDSSQTSDLIDAYLRQLDPNSNRFLNTKEQLKDAGFEGEPYTVTGSSVP